MYVENHRFNCKNITEEFKNYDGQNIEDIIYDLDCTFFYQIYNVLLATSFIIRISHGRISTTDHAPYKKDTL